MAFREAPCHIQITKHFIFCLSMISGEGQIKNQKLFFLNLSKFKTIPSHFRVQNEKYTPLLDLPIQWAANGRQRSKWKGRCFRSRWALNSFNLMEASI